MNTLKVSNLNYKYGNVEVLKNISFEVKEGLVGILGPNGAGKTTTLKLLTTLFAIQDGEISLNNLNYKKDLKDVRKTIGYLPQEFSTYENLKGREFLEIIGSLKLDSNKKNIKKHLDEIIKTLDMNDYIDRKIKQYSGGMKQKLGFAQVLIGDPNLIVVDEPTVGLDPEQRNIIRELFPVISKNRIVLVTTHIVEDIEYYCNYLLVIKAGELIYKGTKENFINEVSELLWESDVDADTLIKINASGNVLTTLNSMNFSHIKYISEEPLTHDSVKVKVNLQDAYIIHSRLKENGVKK
ncbi:ABC transporter ATP-binding protein [Clostridium estertheticum]|uniref:ATP-binding cassette domain-containing protein n=1 Tax=Clostridium estertheticum TaxID=238834 RepID=A0A5N7IX23_9CLOT|nr:ATP-binding cassette domain-containing protein [Clostridium estertheticum]MCB2338849.1 ATP-binding cassette domain-containing protein [Clostridium estertheticum]MPQ30357.1 ATP-binding cassette domain-containing protein [Clostridium estertheticum]MPQ61033.1 ATP-binding cassette domain-containing protein [Clostridium estertheticum]